MDAKSQYQRQTRLASSILLSGELAFTYLDDELRVSRGDKGNLFVLRMVGVVRNYKCDKNWGGDKGNLFVLRTVGVAQKLEISFEFGGFKDDLFVLHKVGVIWEVAKVACFLLRMVGVM